MRTRQTVTISLPPEMIEAVEKVRNAEHRTRSELMREALRIYFTMVGRTYTLTRSELRAIERGRTAIRRGEYFTLDEFRAAVGGDRRQASAKSRRARS
mgnify:CR=1 FL=1